MGDATKKREWKAWGVFGPKGGWRGAWPSKYQADNYSSKLFKDEVRPVTISLAKPKRRAKK